MQYKGAIKKIFQKEQSNKTDQQHIKRLEQNILGMIKEKRQKINTFFYRMPLVLSALIMLLMTGVLLSTLDNGLPNKRSLTPALKKIDYVTKFSSEDEFKRYLANAKDLFQPGSERRESSIPSVPPNIDVQPKPLVEKTEKIEPSLLSTPGDTDAFAQPQQSQQPQRGAFEEKPAVGIEPQDIVSPYRVSQTNVQVLDIDEPDIVKNDKRNIYYSNNYPLKIIRAFPPSNLAKIGTIDKVGNLLLYKDILVLTENDRIIYGFDVSNPSQPSEKWKIKLTENTYVTQARLYNGKIYLVVQTNINTAHPCPLPLTYEQSSVVIPCTQIYHPKVYVPSDVSYTVMSIKVDNGAIEDKVTFVGSTQLSTVYMSSNALYITYQVTADYVALTYQFLKEKAWDLLPTYVFDQLKELQSYNISNRAKRIEFESILEEYKSTLSNEERLKIEDEITNRMRSFSEEYKRGFQKTGIVKIRLSGLSIATVGEVPGKPLNQFSLDEHQGNLRIATTLEGGVSGTSENTNDLYVLDSNLQIIGSVKNLGLEERIYSVRFIGDKAYVVTFREIDPFYVIDLSDPRNPLLKGELKIPGFSSYLHPIGGNKMLGIGQEGSRVKVTLFDISSPENPFKLDTFVTNDYSSEILETHHAFLHDTKHRMFFMPAGNAGYIFSYQGNRLTLVRTISQIQARRALYMNNYMYVLGDNKIVVLNESNWQQVNQLEL